MSGEVSCLDGEIVSPTIVELIDMSTPLVSVLVVPKAAARRVTQQLFYLSTSAASALQAGALRVPLAVRHRHSQTHDKSSNLDLSSFPNASTRSKRPATAIARSRTTLVASPRRQEVL